MNSGNFQERRQKAWQELDQMIDSVEKRKPVEGVDQLPKKFREACSDLALANHRMYGGSVVARLNDLVIRGYKLLYRSRRKGTESFVRFVGVTFPATVRKEWRLFWLCSAMFWIPFFGMMWMAQVNIDWVQSILGPQGMAGMEQMYGGKDQQLSHLRSEYGSNFRMFAFYIEHNIGIDFRMFAGGIVAGLGTIFFTIYNGLAIGASAGYVNYACDPESFWTFVAGHSSFELIGMVIAATAGMRLGMGVLKPGRMSRGKAIAASAKQSLPLIFGAAGMTALAAVVEGFWSAQDLAPMVKYSFGIAMWVLHIAYFTLLGRGGVKLEAVTAELRPRSDWEAVDLGLALVRRDFWSLLVIWFLGMLPMLPLAVWLLPDHPVWFCLSFWWWIPVTSRLVLFKLSRRLFGDDPTKKEVLREFPKAVSRRFFYRMLWARFSPWRPLTMPVEDLEGLKGKDYSVRCRVLMRRGDSSVIVLAMWRMFLSFWMAVTIFCTAALFIPEGAGEGWSETIELWWIGEGGNPPLSLSMALVLSVCCSLGLVDLFSIGAGFGIYVNHRTWVEGWDVELAFRRLGNRLQGIAGVVLVGLLLSFVSSVRADESAEVIEEVLAHEDFEIHTETTKTANWDWLDNWGSGSSSSSGSGGGGLLEVLAVLLKVGLIGGLLVLLAWLVYRYRYVFQRGGGSGRRIKKPQAKVVMGMAVAPESLPENVADAALSLWREGRRHEAMSLLYRASISWMITDAGVEIAESDTESDCLKRVGQAEALHLEYFSDLTKQWMKLAYAREEPGDAELERLCGDWPFSERRVG